MSGRTVEVAPGGEQDVCPLCGIERRFAGYIKESCGEHLREPGCFVGRDLVPVVGVAFLPNVGPQQ